MSPLDFADLIVDVRDFIAMMGDIQEAIRTVDYRDKSSFMELDSWISDKLIFQRDMLLKIQAEGQRLFRLYAAVFALHSGTGVSTVHDSGL